MPRAYLSYDISWTAKLLRRDIHSLRVKYGAKSDSRSTDVKIGESILLRPQRELQRTTENAERYENGSAFPAQLSGCNIVPGPPRDRTVERNTHSSTESETRISTLYELLDSKLKESYASRDRDMAPELRWKFRGSFLLLYLAIQACSSNDSYDIIRDNKGPINEEKMLLEVLQQYTSKGCKPVYKVSKMPTEPYSKRSTDHLRYDSMFSNDFKPIASTGDPCPSPPQVWFSILEAANDAMKTFCVAKELLNYVWPGKKAAFVLEQVGNPHMKFSDADAAELRIKFRELLFPEYETLTTGRD